MTQAEEHQVYDTIVANLQGALERWYSGDPFGYAGLFADEFTYFDPMMNDRLETSGQLRDHYAPMEGTIDLPRFELLDPKLQLEGDIGILTYYLKQYSADGPVGPTWKTTEVYRKGEDEWRAIHAHWSTMPEAG
jgi:hypothetical protein